MRLFETKKAPGQKFTLLALTRLGLITIDTHLFIQVLQVLISIFPRDSYARAAPVRFRSAEHNGSKWAGQH
jgi:hypothetical protein